jgi:hypothetical protein
MKEWRNSFCPRDFVSIKAPMFVVECGNANAISVCVCECGLAIRTERTVSKAERVDAVQRQEAYTGTSGLILSLIPFALMLISCFPV